MDKNIYTFQVGDYGLPLFRQVRNQMLFETDYCILSDSTYTQDEQEAIKIERQKLRDLTTEAFEWFSELGEAMELNQSEASIKAWITEQLAGGN